MSDPQKPSGQNSRLVLFGTLVVAVIGGLVILLALLNRPTPEAQNTGLAIIEGEAFDGITAVDPPRPLQDFTLVGQTGEPVSLRNLRGKMTLILFGYTHCPDVCPLTLLEYKQIKQGLGERADDVNFVFISVDGERDTPEAMNDYINRFDPTFIGLTGDEATLTRIGGDYDLYFTKRPDPSGSAENYLVDHNSSTYLVDVEGNLVALYVFGTESDVIAADIAGRIETA